MKKCLIFCLAFFIMISDCACGSEPPQDEWTVTEGITLRLAQEAYPVGVEKMTLILENHTVKVMLYGLGWYFEKNVGGYWTEVKHKENVAFTLEGYTLDAYDKETMTISTGILSQKLSAGLYRVTGMYPLRVADKSSELRADGEKTDYPAYQLEFKVMPGAVDEPIAATPNPGPWELPAKEDWQWYTWLDGVDMYKRSGMDVIRFIDMAGGLEAFLYREKEDGGNIDVIGEGDQFMLDIIDRMTGKRYVVFDTLTVESGNAAPAEGGGLNVRTKDGDYFVTVADGALIVKKQP